MSNSKYFIDEAENEMGRCLVLTASWSDSLKSVIKKENISVLRLSQSAGWKGDDISFIQDLPGLRGVEIYSWGVKDVTPLQAINDLEYLGLQCEFTKAPDFSLFKKLKVCKLFWRPKAETVFACSGLNFLNIVNYPSEDLKDIQSMTSLKRLQLTSRKLSTLSGVENLVFLSVLDLAECPKLKKISGIHECQQLEVLEIENCKKVYDITLLGKLENLKNIMLTSCGKVKSLQPLVNCQSLEAVSFVGDTIIEDGDLAPLLEIPKLRDVWFVDRCHYTHKRGQILEILS